MGALAEGTWRTLRTVTETFDENGKFLARSETLHTDTLMEVTADDYALETATMVTVGGKHLRGGAQVSRRSLMSDASSDPPLVTTLSSADIGLSDRTIPCQRWELSIGEGAQRRLETVYYSPDVAPYVLRRELVAADGSSTSDLTNVDARVIGVDVPILLEGGMIAGHQLRIRSTMGANTVESLELRCQEAPGGLVRAASTERDPSGRRVRWVVTELEEFGSAGDRPTSQRRWRLFPHRER